MNHWKIIPDNEVKAIHEATLRVLSEVGIVLDHEYILDLLCALGASVQKGRVLIPPELVEKSIMTCGKTVTTRGRGGKSVTLGDGSLHWHNLGGARDVYDPLSGQTRRATVQDVCDSTRLLDALEQATTITPFFTPVDVPGALMSLAMYRYALPNTTKPLQGPGVQTAKEVSIVVSMAEVIGPISEVLTMSVSPVSPLTFPKDLVESMAEIARHKIPFGPLPCPTAGTTAPMSLAGALTQQNAEVLASIVIAQAVQPGLPIIYCGRLAMMEPRTGISVWGGVELGIASAATVQIGHYYGLPVNVYGLSTNAHTLEIQNGFERALNAVLPALAGADELSGIGEMAAGVMGSYAQMVCDNDIAASVRRVIRSFSVNEESLAVDLIKEVMDGQHSFIAQPHTVKYLRSGEILHKTLGVRRSFEEWDRTGRKSLAENAQDRAELILSEHNVPPLDEHQERELERIMSSAEQQLVVG
ncbi:MAG: trimethylamine methyltransferase family protein [Anaerolineales bacterium]|nr:trimethylamine methyltransferase family protein [Anaerolineales bacterium]